MILAGSVNRVNHFLTHLAVVKNVAASTQNQALSALLFLYSKVLKSEHKLDAIRAKRTERLPVVLTPHEVRSILDHMQPGPRRTMVAIMYGAGLRVMEVCRLRVKDIDFDRRQIVVREGKGNKDRYVPLPMTLTGDLRNQMDLVQHLHHKDLELGAGWAGFLMRWRSNGLRQVARSYGNTYFQPIASPSILIHANLRCARGNHRVGLGTNRPTRDAKGRFGNKPTYGRYIGSIWGKTTYGRPSRYRIMAFGSPRFVFCQPNFSLCVGPFRSRRTYLMKNVLLSLVSALLAICSFGTVHAQSQAIDPPWRYTLEPPAPDWQKSKFDDSSWKVGDGGFGTPSTPGSRVGTLWSTSDIWLRREIELASVPESAALLLHHDEDVEVHINGVEVAVLRGYTTEYRVIPLDAAKRQALHPGKNLIAVHCHQTGGGQFIDVHVIDADAIPKLPKTKLSITPFDTSLTTRWGKEVTPENAWREYPRPQMVRPDWVCLNGEWQYTITSRAALDGEAIPSEWTGNILVPFSLESELGGVQRLLDDDEVLWYRRSWTASPKPGHRTLLHFEAVDYRSQIFVNGRKVGSHVGGNTAFSVDATPALRAGENSLVVRVEDDTEGSQLRGKQVRYPNGIWYTRVSGIWQTVWTETVPERSIEDLILASDASEGTISVTPKLTARADGGKTAGKIRVRASLNGRSAGTGECVAGGKATVQIPEPQLWSPDRPNLYDLEIEWVDEAGNRIDRVTSYMGIRTFGKARDNDGHLRLTLNGEPVFHWGTLDQGWWPDGLLTPPSDEAMQFDIRFLKDAGFNMIRKHIKVEPRRYYYHCDRLGMLVWQDQVSGGRFPKWSFLEPNPQDAPWTEADHGQFMAEFEAMVSQLGNAPCIAVWTPFNEAWGQHRTLEVGEWIMQRDPTRAINIASGGNFWPIGDIVDNHAYPHPAFPTSDRFRDFVRVVGEFGGHGLVVPGHVWDASRNNWGYGGLPKDASELEGRYRESIRILTQLKREGIAAGVYTQTTDVEGEVNGLMTYDREVAKLTPERLHEIHQILLQSPLP